MQIKQKEILFIKNQKSNEARKALIYYSEFYCRGKYSLTQLSEFLNLTLGGYSAKEEITFYALI